MTNGNDSNTPNHDHKCKDFLALPPSPRMLEAGNDYFTCNKCGARVNKPKEELASNQSDELYIKTILEQHGVYYGKELLIEFSDLDEAIDFKEKLESLIQSREKKMLEGLEKLPNFNLIKHTGSYTLTYDNGWGKPYIYTGESLEDCLKRAKEWEKK